MSDTIVSPAFLQPGPYHCIREFLGTTWVDRLLAFAVAHEEAFVTSAVGKHARRIDGNVRQSRRLRDFGALRPDLKERFRAVLPAAIAALGLQNSPETLQSLELELAAHEHGGFYAPHIDTATNAEAATSIRVMTGVYYFHSTPKGFTGGALRLYSILPEAQGGSYIDIAPESDMLLLFPSWIRHEVRPVSSPDGNFAQARFAINCWFRQKPA